MGLPLTGAGPSGPGDATPVPVNTVAPTLDNTSPGVGDTVTCSNGTWTNDPTGYAFQWNRDDVDIVGATDASYLVDSADIGTVLTCAVTASNASGPGAPALSDATDPIPSPPSATEFITGQTLNSPRTDGGDYFLGFRFTVGVAGITVTELGRWNYAGDSQTHVLCITDSTGAVLGQVSINASLGTPGSYQYVALGTPVVLSPSTVYAVLSQEPNGDTFNNEGTPITYTAVATVNNAVYAGTTIGQPLNAVAADSTYGPVNFKYT